MDWRRKKHQAKVYEDTTSNYSKKTSKQLARDRPKHRVIFHDGSDGSVNDMDTQYGVVTQYGGDQKVIDKMQPYGYN